MSYIGVDYHKKSFTVCYREIDAEHEIKEYPTTEDGLQQFLGTLSCSDEVAVEAMGINRYFLKKVSPKVKKLTLVNSKKFRWIAESIKKTDRHDAAALAEGLERGILPEARIKSEHSVQISSLLRVRESLTSSNIRTLNLMHALTARNGQPIDRSKLRAKVWRDRVREDNFEFGDRHAWQVLNKQLDRQKKEIVEIEKQLVKGFAQETGFHVLTSIPRIGIVISAYILSYVDGIENFPTAGKFCSYFGLVPRTRITAGDKPAYSKDNKYVPGVITKQGDVRVRTAVVMAVPYVMRHNDSLLEFYNRIRARRGPRKARTAAARKLLKFIFFALKNGKPIEDFAAVDFSRPEKL